MTGVELITATDPYWLSDGSLESANQDDVLKIEALLVGHRVTKVADDHLLLDDGTLLKFVGHDGGCACSAGCYGLTQLNGVDNVITKVELESDPSGDEYRDDASGTYKIFVFADNARVNLATFEGSDGNGYYGTGFYILIRRPEPATAGT